MHRSGAATAGSATNPSGHLLHIDVKKLGRIPDGGGWRLHWRREDVRARGSATTCATQSMTTPGLACIEALPDERDVTSPEFCTGP
ncbi:hypothetical protein GCM10023320_79810 [Pseudonocardia adelaidensis]|uniref:Uncharacterized protein n=1 Tax=Pseudonocardia adelaidensis TaxID=648754 RepID=A0ABP9P6I1_9PSEU